MERLLTKMTGDIGRKIHTGRSRNSQVVQDERLYIKKRIKDIDRKIQRLQKILIKQAESHINTIFPGYTHLRQAQPIILAHYFLCIFHMIQRDRERLAQTLKRTDVLVLGSGALAGSGFDLDRPYLARLLNLSRISPNSMDAVADRDFIAEFLCNICILSVHLSRFAEDLIIWSTDEFNFIELDDSVCTGSSIMPQKKNPDSLELIRGKSARFIGNLNTLLILLKGLPMAYNKDLQEDKEPLFDSVKNINLILDVFGEVISSLKVNKKNIKSRLDKFITATDLADYLTKKNIPFRTSHQIIGKLVKHLIRRNISFSQLSLKELKEFSPEFEEDVYRLMDPGQSIKAREIQGGTGYKSVKRQLKSVKSMMRNNLIR
ncbi:MAG: argininosuccinate lyase [bacterium]